MAARALARWRGHDARFDRHFYKKTGALWLLGKDHAFGRVTFDALRAERVEIDEIPIAEARRRYPQINFSGIRSVLLEPDAGFLLARRACEHVAERVVVEGGNYLHAAVAAPVRVKRGRLDRLTLAGAQALEADAFVFACGPWLGPLFPDVIGKNLTPTRQDVFYFGTPAGDGRFTDDGLPVWVDLGTRAMYGIPGNANRGFKVADDTAGPVFDPTTGDRSVSDAKVRTIRRYLAKRFPALAKAPLVGSEVCQYEATPDSHYIIDRHPAASNVWIVGGGSGHGFKMGPVIGEMVASALEGQVQPDPAFSLARFKQPKRLLTAEKWD
jgi:glycine/D-amino acid oxidase-like deaminating enzyme